MKVAPYGFVHMIANNNTTLKFAIKESARIHRAIMFDTIDYRIPLCGSKHLQWVSDHLLFVIVCPPLTVAVAFLLYTFCR